jgi:hypothetical protein
MVGAFPAFAAYAYGLPPSAARCFCKAIQSGSVGVATAASCLWSYVYPQRRALAGVTSSPAPEPVTDRSLARARAFLGGYAEPRERGLIKLPSLRQFHVSLKLAQCSRRVRALVD